MNWTESKIKELKELWEQGTMAKDIAKTFGTSKNSVIAKANRLNCTPRKRGGATYVRRSHDVPKEEPKEILIIESENPTTLEDLAGDQCRYPLGEDCPPKLFCGNIIVANPPSNWLYCGKHLRICRNPKEKT